MPTLNGCSGLQVLVGASFSHQELYTTTQPS